MRQLQEGSHEHNIVLLADDPEAARIGAEEKGKPRPKPPEPRHTPGPETSLMLGIITLAAPIALCQGYTNTRMR